MLRWSPRSNRTGSSKSIFSASSSSRWWREPKGKIKRRSELLRDAVTREAATDKHPVTPGPLVPASELLGEVLLELNAPAEALAAFEAVQTNEPNRFRAIYGAGRAAELAGDLDQGQDALRSPGSACRAG